jgi:NH3-dependent NAD+ synthetase
LRHYIATHNLKALVIGITKSDCEQFGVETYDIVDATLQEWIEAKRKPDENSERLKALKNNPVVMRHERSHFKRKWPIAIPREVLGMGGVP